MSDSYESGTPRVSSLFIKRAKQEPREEISGGLFLEGYGLEDDIHSQGGSRQVCLLRKEDRENIEQDRRNGLCFDRFRETVQTSGLPLESLETGSRLQMGRAVLRVALKGKKCWPECEIIQSGAVCSLVRTVRFLEVIQTGRIQKNDRIIPAEN